MIFTGSEVVGAVDRDFATETLFVRPRLNAVARPEFLTPGQLGHPLFARRSRMSDGLRFWPDAEGCTRAEAFVADRGGPAFFDRPAWRQELSSALKAIRGRWETEADQEREIEFELAAARDELERRLGTRVAHVCLPWGVTGTVTTRVLRRLNVATAFANRLAGRMAVSAGDHPYFLKRLPNRHIFALPGHRRRVFSTFV
jgi:hypothetical protein